MRLDDETESQNVEDRRGGGGFGGGRATIGIGTIVVALAASYFFGIDPRVVLEGASALQGARQQAQPQAQHQAQHQGAPATDAGAVFTRKVLGNIERTWTTIFSTQLHEQYQPPKLVMFTNATPTACGTGQTAMGPFYCPGDRKVYIDLGFYDDLRRRFGAGGDFAQAYVIAHEVGHHVQNLLGISGKVDAARRRSSEARSNALSVRMELQADCFAGVWANNAQRANQRLIEPGDFEQGLKTAAAIGDDRLQQQGQGYVVPESFTHGSSEQRVYWLRRGLESGELSACDTFAANAH
ncbi:metalloprotease [Burkholderia ubonensis]|uniref:KPN_02809 family neutral zinc metallopeptidase n=1 Tax=Burkholderia TaxID=32008 RepID=UPI0005ACE300|nr:MULTISPECIES: neutral zinc metallopeptidase [Burkholderia]KIP14757.1 neutral zinc metallopeptidase family protein [Burkholderia sp. MSHR3999]KVU38334.1 metalloprotease [Burkholderia ubonensis]OJA36337.1 metalloprotease [Burkholderia ubonensis]OJB37869.1 metalloprotease [Burkholderia ubonensis]OJB54211.1 metalloprotease [Burkholderia ubonensis]